MSTEQIVLRGEMKGHGNWVTSIATTPENPDMILTASRDKTVIVWRLTRDEDGYGKATRALRGRSLFSLFSLSSLSSLSSLFSFFSSARPFSSSFPCAVQSFPFVSVDPFLPGTTTVDFRSPALSISHRRFPLIYATMF
jgi:hypothetical protein